jgi:hypothetical protein
MVHLNMHGNENRWRRPDPAFVTILSIVAMMAIAWVTPMFFAIPVGEKTASIPFPMMEDVQKTFRTDQMQFTVVAVALVCLTAATSTGIFVLIKLAQLGRNGRVVGNFWTASH